MSSRNLVERAKRMLGEANRVLDDVLDLLREAEDATGSVSMWESKVRDLLDEAINKLDRSNLDRGVVRDAIRAIETALYSIPSADTQMLIGDAIYEIENLR